MADSRKDSVPVLNSCCCCISLRTGGLIIGWFTLVYGFMTLFTGFTPTFRFIGDMFTPGERDPILAKLYVVSNEFVLFFCIFSSAYLIAGINQRRADYVLPWIMIDCLSTVQTIGYIFLLALSSQFKDDMRAVLGEITTNKYTLDTMTDPIRVSLSTLLSLYFLLVVYSLYKEIKGAASNTVRSVV